MGRNQQTVLWKLPARAMGTWGRGAHGLGQRGCWAQRAHHSLTASTPQCGDRSGFKVREGKGLESTHRPWSPILWQAGPGRPCRVLGEAAWTKSLSFTWAGVQPQNSSPKTKSHERRKIERRRIIHTSSSCVGAEQCQPQFPAPRCPPADASFCPGSGAAPMPI